MPHRGSLPIPATARPEAPVRAERFRAALQTRVLGRAGLGDTGNFRALLLEKGDAVLRTGDDVILPLTGPVMGWMPWKEGMRLELSSGAQGTHLFLGDSTLDRVLQRRAEAAELRFLVARSSFMRLGPDNSAGEAVAGCFTGILSETLNPGPMSAAVVESLLHVLLVHLHRNQPASQGDGTQTGSTKALAGRFTALVESHFREHWRVERYARELGVSRDRLNDLCLRAYGRPPARLIRERLLVEARIYLSTSTLALGQIAGILGFGGASQFSRFFKSLQGQSPARYRLSPHHAAQSERAKQGALHAWP
ncbi:AraC family transcriptional regulator [Ciceribacter sp. L1K22]|uniref:helix-turn-helix transcriptional regulator n=1 Tax=Ciceribacter sp. L1K22 TaxID=2820275 RepID=UPI001ABEC52E|nr:AraC family transcriptional regulator [Ciceribacter sp. L1K22]MBO3761791.1 helix-turn-helix domain-containing protein [Ciceribacter sp. L1K22]